MGAGTSTFLGFVDVLNALTDQKGGISTSSTSTAVISLEITMQLS
ncbi:MAG: hypothetical protein ACJAW2_000271 [Shewanella sp.]